LFPLTASLALFAAYASLASENFTISFFPPFNGETTSAPLLLNIPGYGISSVEYFAGTNSIGTLIDGQIIVTVSGTIDVSAFIFMRYWDPKPGTYTLTAKATDYLGNTAVSDPIQVTIVPTTFVTVEATKQSASPDSPGIFTIRRSGPTNSDLSVAFSLGGNANNELDIRPTPDSITIPAGRYSTSIPIEPIRNSPPGELKFVTLTPNIYFPPVNLVEATIRTSSGKEMTLGYPLNPPYQIGSPARAAIYLQKRLQKRHHPSVRIIDPKPRQLFAFDSDISITAQASDPDTFVTEVDFFDGKNQIGATLTTNNPAPSTLVPFDFTWTNAPIGPHTLRAIAIDTDKNKQISPPVRIQVLPAP
jgi:hypothetical protein